MRVIVTGSRDWSNVATIYAALETFLKDAKGRLVLVHGNHPTGADAIADQWAINNHIPIARYTADWDTHGRAAGPKRNEAMVKAGAHHCLAFIAPCTSPRCTRQDPHGSHGATGCADLAENAGIPTRRLAQPLEEK